MISLIVCSVNPERLESFKENVRRTVGSGYEFVIIDNRTAGYSIFEAYNAGVKRSHGDILCFAHEDIVFYTDGWGLRVEEHFRRNAGLGALGCVGTHVVLKGKDWRDSPYFSVNLIQRRISHSPEKTAFKYHCRYGDRGRSLNDAVALDGLWMCIRASLFDRISFDEDTFKGFHQYDADICLQVLDNGMSVGVCFDVLMEHLSEGSFNPSYFDALKLLLAKWDAKLPLIVGVGSSGLKRKRYRKWAGSPQWSGADYDPEERSARHQDSFLRDFGKAAPTLSAALEEIGINKRCGYITARRARQLRIKTTFYHLTGLFRNQRRINSGGN